MPCEAAVTMAAFWALLHGKRRHGAGAELLQPRLLLRRQHDRIRGPRVGHLKSPPTLAKVSKTLVCQAFSHCTLLCISCAGYYELSFRGSSFAFMYSRPSGPIAVTCVT